MPILNTIFHGTIHTPLFNLLQPPKVKQQKKQHVSWSVIQNNCKLGEAVPVTGHGGP
jgi:hypothetical protein